MFVRELTTEQIYALKQAYLMEKLDREEHRCPSWGELADAGELVSDEEIFGEYDRVEFSPDDFL